MFLDNMKLLVVMAWYRSLSQQVRSELDTLMRFLKVELLRSENLKQFSELGAQIPIDEYLRSIDRVNTLDNEVLDSVRVIIRLVFEQYWVGIKDICALMMESWKSLLGCLRIQ